MGKELFFSAISIKEAPITSIQLIARQAHNERNQKLAVYPEHKENALVKTLNKTQINKTLNCNLPVKKKSVCGYYLWALWDIYPSFEVHRPPILSGLTDNQSDVIDIARQNGLDTSINFNPKYDCNVRLQEIADYDVKLISYQKRQTGLYFFCVWGNHFQYLCGIEPIFQQDNITEAELSMLKITWGDGDWAGSGCGGYIKEYIRKREAKRKLSTPKKGSNDAHFIEFLYSPQNTWYIPRKRWVWQRHRIVKKTKDFIYIEEFPYYGGSYLKTGWQAFIVYTIMINLKELEETHQFNHHSRRKIFYEKCAVPELKTYQFNTSSYDPSDDDYEYDDSVIEIPLNKVQWAINLLNINKWPATREEIKKAFNPFSMKLHPDRGGDNKLFAKYRKAHNTLINEINKNQIRS